MSSTAKHVIRRLALGPFMTLLLAGCGSGPTSVLSAPSAPSTACTPPSFPGMSGGPSSIPCGPYVVSGVVIEAAGPIAGVNISAFVETSGLSYSYVWAHGALLTDGAGHYRMNALPAGAHLWFQVWKDGYVQQCAAPSVTIQGDMTMDLALVPKANLTASTAQSAPGFRSVSGTIVETTSAGKQPVAGAFVDWEPLEDFPAAVTYSDRAGRFALCGLPQDETVRLRASLVFGRIGYADIPPGQTAGVEITLP